MWGDDSEQRAFGEIWPLWHGAPGVRDRRLAVKRLRKLADQGYAPAQFALGWAYFDGDGVRRDYAKSFEYCRAAAEQRYPAAEGMLGTFYAMAKPKHGACELDPVRAAYWYRRGAEGGNPGAQYNLASGYRTGYGVEKDFVEAFVWASLAVHCNSLPRDRMSETIRDEAAAALSPEQKAVADQTIQELIRDLPHAWSEPTAYWRLLAERAGALQQPEDA